VTSILRYNLVSESSVRVSRKIQGDKNLMVYFFTSFREKLNFN